MLQHLRRERHDLHVLLLAQLARHRAEDARRARLSRLVDEDRGVLVEPDVGAVLAARLLRGADDDRLGHVALLHLAGRDGVLDRHHDGVAEAGIPALAPAEDADHQRAPGAAVVRDAENRFLLDHGIASVYFARSTISVTRQLTVFAIGRVSMMRTVSPAFAPSSSCALIFFVRVTCLL